MADRNGRKHRLVEVTDPEEIEAIKRGDLIPPIGGPGSGRWWAERPTLDAYRKARQQNSEGHS